MPIYEICPSNCIVENKCIHQQDLDETELPEGLNGRVLNATLYKIGERIGLGNASYDLKSFTGVARFVEDFFNEYERQHEHWACDYLKESDAPCYDEFSLNCFLFAMTSDLVL